jgi:hypothetical protein
MRVTEDAALKTAALHSNLKVAKHGAAAATRGAPIGWIQQLDRLVEVLANPQLF